MKGIIKKVKYWGCINIITKVYEKTIIDRKRFQTGNNMKRIIMPDYQLSPIVYDPYKQTKRMTIFYLVHRFYPHNQGGTERFVLNLSTILQKKGNRPVVLTLGEGELKDYTHHIGDILYRQFEVEGITVIEFRYIKTPRGVLYKNIECDRLDLYKLAEYFLELYRPDIVHCAYPQPMASFLQCCIDRGQPYIVTLTDFNITCHYATMIKKDGITCEGSLKGKRCSRSCNTCIIKDFQQRYKNAEHLLHHARYVTSPSKFAASMIYKEFSEVRPVVIPHGIGKQFRRSDRRYSEDEMVRYAYIGKLAPLKGVHLLIEAFIKADVTGTLDIYGAGSSLYVKKLKKLAKESNKIVFHGNLLYDTTPEVYQGHDVVIVPSMCYETYNFVVREAIACGCFVIGADIGGIPEAIIEGENGITFEAGNLDSLIHAIKLANVYSPNGRGDFATIEQEVSAYLNIYNRCLE